MVYPFTPPSPFEAITLSRRRRHHPPRKTRKKQSRTHAQKSHLAQEQADQVISVINRLAGPAGPKDILKALGWPRGRRQLLNELLPALVEEGLLHQKNNNCFSLRAEAFISGELTVNPRGFGFVSPAGATGRENDIFIGGRNLGPAIHGDQVLVQIIGGRKGKDEGRVVAVSQRSLTELVGIFHPLSQGGGRLIPDDSRLRLEITIPPGQERGAEEGQAVRARISLFQTETLAAQAQVQEVLGDPALPQVQMAMVIASHRLPKKFSPETMAQVAKIPATVRLDDQRLDLREIPHVTIDGETARDFDDAVAVSRLKDGFRLHVSIADVSHYVQPGTPLDQEAYERGTSVYFPTGVLPMLPERLSNGLCSLNPHEKRYAFTAIIDFDRQGKRRKSRFGKSVIESRHRLTYNQVWAIISGEEEEPELHELISPMIELAEGLGKMRHRRGSLDFDLPEAEIIINDDQQQVLSVERRARNQAHRIIEEFMLAANEAVAAFLAEEHTPCLYRIHEAPNPLKVEEFAQFTHNVLGQLPPDQGTPHWYNAILAQTHESPAEYVINNLMLRTMQQARYSPDNSGHFGLAAPCYCHFTSPIRRYPDLQVHRALAATLARKAGKKKGGEDLQEGVAELLSGLERRAVDAERDMHSRLKAAFMLAHVGETFSGIISGVSSYGLFVELDHPAVGGGVAMADLGNDYFVLDDKNHRLTGRSSGRSHRLGDLVTVVVDRVDLSQHRVNFRLVTEG
ncbi:MAG: ribonuclease R [Thermodesulfobacteriota bacterium]